jgi:hypothetical protein
VGREAPGKPFVAKTRDADRRPEFLIRPADVAVGPIIEHLRTDALPFGERDQGT